MSIRKIVYFATLTNLSLFSFPLYSAAAPLFEQFRLTLFQIMTTMSQAQIPFNLIVILGVVSLWRGAWGLMDIHLFPKNSSLSYIVSFIIGIIILSFTYDLAKQFL